MASKTKHTVEFNAKDRTKGVLGNIQAQLAQLRKGFGGVTTAAKGFVAVLAVREVVGFTKDIIDAGAQFEVFRNQLRLVTNGQEDLNRVFGLLQQTAVANRTSFEETIGLFTRLRISTEALGISEERVVNVTSKLSQALQVAGADGNTTASVIRQFGQAMASGEVRGDEFRSLVEGLGPALAIMARESGITVGELRKMSQAGELTAETMFKMLENSNSLSESFNKMAVTTGQLETRFRDSFRAAASEIAKATKLQDIYKDSLQGLIDIFDQIAGTETAVVNMETVDIIEKAKNQTIGLDEAIRVLTDRLTPSLGELMFGGAFDTESIKDASEALPILEEIRLRQLELEAIQKRMADAGLDEQVGMDAEGVKEVEIFLEARKKQQKELDRTIFLHKQYAVLRVKGEELASKKTQEALQKDIKVHQQYAFLRTKGEEMVAAAADRTLQKDIQVHKQGAFLINMANKNLQDTTKGTAPLLAALKKVIGEGFDPMNQAVNVLAGGMNTFRDTASSALADVIMGTRTLSDALGTIVNSTLKALLQGFINLGITVFILEPLERFLRGQEATQRRINAQLRMELALRTALAFFGIGLPGRADGGPVTKNSPYVVGERGPELFIPRSSGNIISNKDSQAQLSGVGGGGPVTVNFNIVANDTRGFDELLMSRRATIQGIINGALHQRGKMGVV